MSVNACESSLLALAVISSIILKTVMTVFQEIDSLM